jgi:WD40 repeat-containing protein SMU1
VLQLLDSLDLEKCRRSYCDDYSFAKKQHHGDGDSNNDNPDGAPMIVTPLEKAVAMVHEMAILELAEQNEVELAYAALRMSSELLDGALSSSGDDGDGEMQIHQQQQTASYDDPYGTNHSSSRSGDVERRIAALTAMRDPTTSTPSSTSNNHLPPNYYGPSNPTCQKRRDKIVKLLRHHIPEVPLKRLSSLLQQSIKWQCHTGVFPTVQRLFQHATDDDEEQAVDEEVYGKKERKKKKHKSNTVDQRFDLVLGNVDITLGEGKKKRSRDAAGNTNSNNTERIPSRIHQTIRLGKRSFIECACFLPDGRGIITGSSDGFIEIWGEPLLVGQSSSSTISKKDGASTVDSSQKELNSLLILPTDINYEKLRTSDLPYQRKDDLMMHATNQSVLAMTVSHDGTLLGTTSSEGTVYIWKISDGKLLRKIERAHGGIGDVNSDKGE